MVGFVFASIPPTSAAATDMIKSIVDLDDYESRTAELVKKAHDGLSSFKTGEETYSQAENCAHKVMEGRRALHQMILGQEQYTPINQ